jgi:glycosyltransferase involved in cell wall biosynthesis
MGPAPLNLLLVAGRFPAETFVYRKAVALARRGHRVTVASRAPGDWSKFPDPLPETLSVEVWPPDSDLHSPARVLRAIAGASRALRDLRGARALLELVKRDSRTHAHVSRNLLRHLPLLGRKFDIIHFEFLVLAPMYPLVRELTGARILVSCRGTETHTLEQRPDEQRAAMIAAFRDADAVHCTSAELVRAMTAIGGERSRVFVNRPALEVAQIGPCEYGRQGPLRIVTTGRLVWQKGHDYLLTALAQLRARGVDFHAQIIGDGELRPQLAFSIRDLDLGECVELTGALASADVLARMREADVFVLSSHTEGISNAVVEAMAVGLPIVTTDAGGMREVVDDGVHGFVVPVRDAAAIADRLAILAHDKTKREEMGRAARARALIDFTTEQQAAVFEDVYRELLA